MQNPTKIRGEKRLLTYFGPCEGAGAYLSKGWRVRGLNRRRGLRS